jgi:xanthine dehydrogenase/oxidase
LAPEEVIVSIQIPATRKNEFVRAYKQSRRRDDDIAIESACYRTFFERGTRYTHSFSFSFSLSLSLSFFGSTDSSTESKV